MAFTFGDINVQAKKHVLKLKAVDSIVLQDNSEKFATYDYNIVILVDEPYNSSQLRGIELFLKNNGIYRYKIISSVKYAVTKQDIKDDQKSGLAEFYRVNSANFWEHIEDDAVIVTVGSGIYGLLKSDAIYPNSVHQFIFGKNYFWYSRQQDTKGHWVYPIESFRDIFACGFSSKPVDSFITNIAMHQLKAASSRKSIKPPADAFAPCNIVIIENEEEFETLFYEANKHRKNEVVAWDLETSGLDFLQDRIGCTSLSFDGETAYCIPWDVINKRKFNAILERNIQLGANLKFDVKFSWRNGIPAARIDEDVVLLGHTLDETRSNSLKALTYFYSSLGGYDYELEEYKRTHPNLESYLDIPGHILYKYAAIDAIATYRVFMALRKHCEALDKRYPNKKGTRSLYSYYKDIRVPAANMFASVEYEGMYVNIEEHEKARAIVTKRVKELSSEMAAELGVTPTFDFNSPTALGKLLQAKNWPNLGLTKSGVYQVADFQLARWAKDYPVAKLIQEYRSAQVVLNTFIGNKEGTKGWSQYFKYHEEDDSYRIHTNFNTMGTESGRSRCSEPNLMNIPAHGLFSTEFKRSIGTPDDDNYLIVTIDYSGLQLRLAAIDADEPVLCPAYRKDSNLDVHSLTTYNIFLKDKEYEIELINVKQDGKHYQFLGGQYVDTVNRGHILASELLPEDTLVT